MNRGGRGGRRELDARLVAAFHSYRQGLCQLPLVLSVMPARDFDSLCFLGTLGWVSPAARLQLNRLNAACGRGLIAARQGRLDDASRAYGQAEEILDPLRRIARSAWLLGVSTYQAGTAYLDFRCDRPERAADRLSASMDADLELEDLGLPVMQMGRIQQGHNLVRMSLRLGRRTEGIRLAGTLLAYLEHRVEGLPYHRDWRPRLLRAVPRSLRQAMIHQIVGETASFLVIGETPAEEWRELIGACRLCPDPEAAVSPQVQHALWAQHHRLAGNLKAYFQDLERLFLLGIRGYHQLWYSVLLELLRVCRSLDSHLSRQVGDWIVRDSAKWKGLSPWLRERFELPAKKRTVA